MVASAIPSNLTPLSWTMIDVPEDRDLYELPIADGELCFAVLLYRPPKRSKWKPRTPDCIPPWHVGRKAIFYARRNREFVVKDCREFNVVEMRRVKLGRRVSLWAVAVQLIFPFEETVKPIDLLSAQGGRSHD